MTRLQTEIAARRRRTWGFNPTERWLEHASEALEGALRRGIGIENGKVPFGISQKIQRFQVLQGLFEKMACGVIHDDDLGQVEWSNQQGTLSFAVDRSTSPAISPGPVSAATACARSSSLSTLARNLTRASWFQPPWVACKCLSMSPSCRSSLAASIRGKVLISQPRVARRMYSLTVRPWDEARRINL